jgi:hypothetical protein
MKNVSVYLSIVLSLFLLSVSTGICQPSVSNGSFDGTTTGWTNCSSGTPEMTYSQECYDIAANQSACVQYSSCTTGCAANPAPNYSLEVDQGNSPGACQTISSGLTAGSSYTLHLDMSRRTTTFAGGKGAPATTQVDVCITSSTSVSVCTTFVMTNTTFGYTTSNFSFTAPAGGGPYTLQITNTSTYGTGTDNNYGMVFGKICFSCTTPITLLSFNAVKNGRRVDIFWQTASEINNDYFTVEKSKNGIDFIVTESIKGAGNSQSKLNYETTDHSPYNDISYYRLKQTDFDGKVSYSEIEKVNFSDNKNITVYPNPGTGIFKIEGLGTESEITVHNLLGQTILTKRTFSDSSEIDLSSQPSGIYFVKVTNGGTSTSSKIILHR